MAGMTEGKTERAMMYWNFEAQKENTMKIEGWIETHSIQFSINDLSRQLSVDEDICRKVVESNPLVRTIEGAIGKSGPQKRYVSVATPPRATIAGTFEVFNLTERERDTLGRDARADYYELVRVKSLCLHQGKVKHPFTSGGRTPKIRFSNS